MKTRLYRALAMASLFVPLAATAAQKTFVMGAALKASA
jgi:hypothetical protein